MLSERSNRGFLGVSALVFVASAAATVVWCGSMSRMDGMPMPGGWTMSMAWMRMPGQTWSAAAATFLGMWIVMMVAMMMPCLVPMLWRYRRAVGGDGVPRLGRLTIVVGAGYFSFWTLLGAAAYPVGVALAAIVMEQPALARAVPAMIAVVVLVAGALQFTAWKTHHLQCCHRMPAEGRLRSAGHANAWRYGFRVGVHCFRCCGNLMVLLLVLGVMDLRAMAIVTVAIAAERLAPATRVVARALGVIVIGAGLLMLSLAAHAEAPPRGGQAPGWYRTTVGRFEITARSDGTVPAPEEAPATTTPRPRR